MSVYDIVTEIVLKKIEAGTNPWVKPWSDKYGNAAACNFKTKKAYRGINRILTNMSGYSCPFWVTYKQAQELGGSVRKGEKSTLITYFQLLKDKQDEKKNIPILKYYQIFNIEQCDGIELPELPAVEKNHIESLESAEKIAKDYSHNQKIEIRYGGNRAYYSPMNDYVNLPERDTFTSQDGFYSTMFHELGHSTGHKSRLARGLESSEGFGSVSYSKEELVAELCAAFLCSRIGLDNLDQSAAYLKGWIKPLQDNPKWIVSAAGQAEKAAEFISQYSKIEEGEEVLTVDGE